MIKRTLVSFAGHAGIAVTSSQAPAEKATPLDLVAIGKAIDERMKNFQKHL